MKKIREDINIFYEDNHIIVCNKPEGVLSQEDITQDDDMLTIIKRYLKEEYQKKGNVYLGLVQRLDRRVSGVMVFAKTSKAASRLSEDIRNHKFEKNYLAVVTGYLEGEGLLENKLEKVDNKAVLSDSGKESKLFYKTLRHFQIEKDIFTILEIELYSGRFNQIRKQLSIIGHPIINDFKYGYNKKNYDNHLGLYCVSIGFFHPVTKEWLKFELPMNNDFVWSKYY